MERYEATSQVAEAQLEAQLMGLLTGVLLDAPDELDALYGCAPIETETIETDFLPPNKKIIIALEENTEEILTLYYIKTDAHDPNPFHMPDGKLRVGETYDVTHLSKSSNGLVVSIGYQGRGNDFFYTNSLDGLSLHVVEKSEAEKAQDQLRQMGRNIAQYEYFWEMAKEYEEEALRLEQAVQNLPVFDASSTYRYSIDSSLGATLYRIDETSGALEDVANWTLLNGSSLTGKFFGNRLAVVYGKLLLIDDETSLAMGAVISKNNNRAIGLSHLQAVDISKLQDHRGNSGLVAKLSITN